MKRTPLKRRSKPLKQTARRGIDRQASEAWAHAARQKGCVMCGSANAQGHHVIKQQVLKRRCTELGVEYERVRWDRRNLLALCERHHAAHHAASHRLALSVVVANCPKVMQFARELDLVWWLEREYIVDDREAA